MLKNGSISLISDGDTWRERSRSGGQLDVFLVSKTVFVSAGFISRVTANCGEGPQGRPNSIILGTDLQTFEPFFYCVRTDQSHTGPE